MSFVLDLRTAEGLLTSEGELHHSQRQLIQPIFQPDEISKYANIMTDYAQDISSRWNDDHHGTNRYSQGIHASDASYC